MMRASAPFEYSELGNDGQLTELERSTLADLFRKPQFEVESIRLRRHDDGGFDAILGVSFMERGASHGDHGSRSRISRQTVACFARPGLGMPPFAAWPRRGFLGALASRMMNLAGAPTVELPEHEDLNRRWMVMSFHPESTRRLVDQHVADALRRHDDLTVRTGAEHVAVYRKNVTVPPAEEEEFHRSAREVAGRIIESAGAMPQESKPSGEEAVETIREMDGWIGRQIRGQLVTARQVDDLLAQRPPRAVPRTIRKRAYGSSGFFILFGAVLSVIGASLAAGMSLAGDDEIPYFVPYALSILPLIGITVIVLALRYRWLRRRILRGGACEPAKVVAVKATGVHANDDQQHDVTFETRSGQVVVRVTSGPATRARELSRRGEPARLLVDRAAPSRGLWIGGWAVDAGDF